jgi:Xaa-Pro aminopeptidase
LEAAIAGAELVAIDQAARGLIAQAGYGDHFGHGLGHGVGLEIHEAPMIGPRSVGRLQSSTPFTLEPGIYLPGRGGVRIEDTVVVEAGGARVLTAAHRGPRVVG